MEEGKTEPGEETGRKRGSTLNNGEGIPAYPVDTVEDPFPCRELCSELVDPCIQCGDSDLPAGAQIPDGMLPVQIGLQDRQDEAERVGTVGDQDIREDGVGMSAGRAPDHRDRHYPFAALPILHGDHPAMIGSDLPMTAHRPADRALLSGETTVPDGVPEKNFVGRRNFKLVKKRNSPYHSSRAYTDTDSLVRVVLCMFLG